jgi:membrane-bound lytic murein transglycosylase MltF
MQFGLIKFLWFFLAWCFTQIAFAQPNTTNNPRSYPEMLVRGEVRMAVPYGRITYVQTGKTIMGVSPEISKYLGEFLSAKYKKRIQVKLVPTVPGQLLNVLDQHQADFLVDYFHETKNSEERNQYLVYRHPRPENYVVVSNAQSKEVTSLKDLTGQTICVGRLSYLKPLETINQELSDSKKITIFQDSLVLSDEDFLQMTDAGLIQHVWVARWKAELWKPVLRNIQINEATTTLGGSPSDLIFHKDQQDLANDVLAFVNSPYLDKALNAFRNKDFAIRKNALRNPIAKLEWQRFESMRTYFHQYGKENRLDPLFLAGLGFQESSLNQSAQSPVGAIGVMQLLPATGASMKVGDIRELQPNIHAGTKYINSLLYAMSLDQTLTDSERAFFAVAAYNAGPNNIRKARELAAKMGFDPNKWFFNVEMAAAKLVGSETFLYVRNVYKYYITYDVWDRKIKLSDERPEPQRPNASR